MIKALAIAILCAIMAFLGSYAFREYAISRRWSMIPRLWPGVIYTFVVTFTVTWLAD